MKHALHVLAATAFLANPGVAATLDTPTGLVVFGDSLSDPGNLPAAAAPPAPPYYDDDPGAVLPGGAGVRFSNGPVWAEHVDDLFPVSANFAFGDAQAATDGLDAPDFGEQIDLYEASGLGAALGDDPVAAVWFGANDIFGGLASGAADAGVVSALAGLSAGLAELRGLGFDDFIVFNLPDLGDTPLYDLALPILTPIDEAILKGGANAATAAFNAGLDLTLDALEGSGAHVTRIDVNALFADLLENPASFGVSETELPCAFLSGSFDGSIVANAVGEPLICDPQTAMERAFFDFVHPNATVHAALADRVISQIAPIPLPAGLPFLALGLGGLAFVGRRSRR